MAGVTDTVFRQMIRSHGGCGLMMTEFTSSHGIVGSSKGRKMGPTLRYLAFEESERPISAQLFGSDPEVMADAARICQDMGFDAVDINFGCPGEEGGHLQRRLGDCCATCRWWSNCSARCARPSPCR